MYLEIFNFQFSQNIKQLHILILYFFKLFSNLCLSLVKFCESFIKLLIPFLQARNGQVKFFLHISNSRGYTLKVVLDLFNNSLQFANPLIIWILIYPSPEWHNGRVFEKENANRIIDDIRKSQLSSFESNFIKRIMKKLEDLLWFSDDVGKSSVFTKIGFINSKEVVVLILKVQCLYC